MNIKHISLPDRPVLLAPMEDITDRSFRTVCKWFGADMMYTEFISADGLIQKGRKGEEKLVIHDYERPVGVQIFGNNISVIKQAVEMAELSHPDCIDLNFGCPVRKIVKKGAGAGLLKDIPRMKEITRQVVQHTRLPVTVKTRIGWDERQKNIVEIAKQLQDAGISALTIHGRTATQLYKGVADWESIAEVKQNPEILIPVIGNGDIDSPRFAAKCFEQYKVDGIMIGRASIGNPWIFRDIKYFLKTGELLSPPSIAEKVKWVKIHLQRSIELKGEYKGILEMRTHFSNYFKGLPHIKKVRQKLVTTTNPYTLYKLLDSISDEYER